MKRVNSLLIAAFVAASSMFVSCDKDEEDVIDPSVSVKATYGSQSEKILLDGEDITADLGTIVTFKITFNMGTNKLREVHMKSTIGTKVFNVLDSINLDKGLFNTGAKSIDFTYQTNVGLEKEVLTFQTIDTKEREDMFTVNILKPAPPEPEEGEQFVATTIVLLGGQSNATLGSFYSVKYGKVMTIGAATSQSADVDFAYYYGSSNKATIAAPANDQAQTISYGSTKMSSWSKKNNTKFYRVDTENTNASEFYGVGDFWDDAMGTLDSTSSTDIESHAKELAVNNVVFFKTDGGIKGVFVVEKITGTNAQGSIELKLIEKVAE